MTERLIDYFKNLLKEVGKCRGQELALVYFSGIIAILWPLGGLIIYLISKKTKLKTYGKVAITATLIRVFAYGFAYGLSHLIYGQIGA